MKKRVFSIFLLLFLCLPLIFSCTGGDTKQTAAPSEPSADTAAASETEKTQTGPAADTSAYETLPEKPTEATETPTTEAPEPNPYGIFTYDHNTVNVNVSSPYCILINAKTNEILFTNCDVNEKIYPASTTKLLTAIIALKYGDPAEVFTPGDELDLVASDSSKAYIKSHHKLTLEMLIEGMMLPSGGDAAYVVAAGVGRIIAGNDALTSVEAVAVFIDEMNKFAEEHGLAGSHFTCPDGYHDDDHYTTLLDIMTVSRLALDEPIIMKYAGLYDDDVKYASGHKITWTNTNLLLDKDSKYYYENAIGLKTGTTDEAGYCLVSAAALGSKKVLAGVFAAPNTGARFNDSRALLVAGMVAAQ